MMDAFTNFWNIYSNVVLSLGVNALLALSIWITLDCGMLSIANAAFMGIGAYTAAYLTVHFGVNFYVALAVGVVAPTIVAAVIGLPVVRLSGIYLAMATLAFGEVMVVAATNADSITGGAMGMNGIPQLTQWWQVLLALVIVLLILMRMRRSRFGRAIEAIRNDEVAAELMGINTQSIKLMTFIAGAAIAGLAGGLEAHLTFFIAPNEFGFERAVNILTMGVLGGITSLVGPVIGGIVITLLPELFSSGSAALIINGAILVVVVLFLPRGIWDPIRYTAWLKKVFRKDA